MPDATPARIVYWSRAFTVLWVFISTPWFVLLAILGFTDRNPVWVLLGIAFLVWSAVSLVVRLEAFRFDGQARQLVVKGRAIRPDTIREVVATYSSISFYLKDSPRRGSSADSHTFCLLQFYPRKAVRELCKQHDIKLRELGAAKWVR